MNRKITKRVNYNDKFKADALKSASQLGVTKAARKLGIKPSTLWNWVSKERKRGIEIVPLRANYKNPRAAKKKVASSDSAAFADLVRERIVALDNQITEAEDNIDEMNRRRRALEEFLEI